MDRTALGIESDIQRCAERTVACCGPIGPEGANQQSFLAPLSKCHCTPRQQLLRRIKIINSQVRRGGQSFPNSCHSRQDVLAAAHPGSSSRRPGFLAAPKMAVLCLISALIGVLISFVSAPSVSATAFQAQPALGSMPSTTDFVQKCGARLCLGGTPFVIHGATAYGTYNDSATEVALAKRAKVNTLAIVEFETKYHSLSDTTTEATWSRVDTFIAAAKAVGLHVVLTLSSYAQSLQKAGKTPTRTDWHAYLNFIANRINTVTGVRYKDEPTIAMVQLWGEICYPGESDSTCPAGTSGTATDMIDFYHRTLTQWKSLAPKILVTTGGFSHLNNSTSSGIPWQTIMADPANPICELEINSPGDVKGAVGKVTSMCAQLGKPWYLAAWSSCYADSGYPFYLSSDSAMAGHAQDMYSIQRGGAPAVMPAVGGEFWNLRDKGTARGHCDIGPAFPMTFGVIQRNAPH